MRKALTVTTVAVLLLVIAQTCMFHDTANEKVVEKVRKQHSDAPWMKHVTEWGTKFSITVETDYQPDSLSSYEWGYTICQAVKAAYASGATDLPNLRVYGTDVERRVKVDGSRSTKRRLSVIAQSTSASDYACAITPPTDLLDRARSLKLRISRR